MNFQNVRDPKSREERGSRAGRGEQRGGREVGKEKLGRMPSCRHRPGNRRRYVEEED